ncbi:MobV family relaxase [Flavobacterium sp.]|jgi:hypothetical protein|uniref:MobV family relaxase n=1 Tax=Flavobacterium sp. TaxID=239 RepID=UPI0037C11A3B
MKQIVSFDKLKNFGQIGASSSHTYRTRETPNADEERFNLNRYFRANTVEQLTKSIKERIAASINKPRSNAVLCMEYFVSASPEFFEEDNGKQWKQFFNDTVEWLDERHGKENVVGVVIHLDEKTPHMHAYVVPIDKRGHLCAKTFIDGRQKLREMQDSFFDKVSKKYGVERGMKGALISHQKIQTYYGHIEKALDDMPSVEQLKRMKIEEHIELTQGLFVKTQELKQQNNLLEKERVKLSSYNLSLENKNKLLTKSIETFKKITKKLIKSVISKDKFNEFFKVNVEDDPLKSFVESGQAESEEMAALKIASKVQNKTLMTWFDKVIQRLAPNEIPTETKDEVKKSIKLGTDL